MKSVTLSGNNLDLLSLLAIAQGAKVKLAKGGAQKMAASRRIVAEKARGTEPIYGVNTGFGYLARKQVSIEDLSLLQENIVRSHAAGWGAPLSVPETRLVMALKLNLLIKGYSGVRFRVARLIAQLLNSRIHPIIPKYGSVGASGDLIPLAHLALPLIGEGLVSYKGKRMNAKRALEAEKLSPLKLVEKEGLSFVNGTEVMQAVGGLALVEGFQLIAWANLITALTYESLSAHLHPLDARIHKLRGHRGQKEVAKALRTALKGSYLHQRPLKRSRVQDPYSLRCVPQVHGAALDSLWHAETILRQEMNAVTDNPLVFADREDIVSGGNFHGEPLALIFDFAAMALAEVGNLSDRRLELLCNPHKSELEPFLSPEPGLNSGLMTFQYLSASLVSRNKILSHPASTDSIPGNVGVEDHVSMGMTSALKLREVVENLRAILAAEFIAAGQAVHLRQLRKMGQSTWLLYRELRKKIPPLEKDRQLSADIDRVVKLLTKQPPV